MEPILTDQEKDALSALQSGESEAIKEVRSIDLVSRDHRAFAILPELQTATDRYAEAVGRIFSRELKLTASGMPYPVEVVPGSQLEELWGMPRFIYSLTIDDQPVGGVVAIDGPVGDGYIVSQFGGVADGPPMVDGPPTPTERRTAGRLAGALVEALVHALKPVTSLRASVNINSSERPTDRALVMLSVSVTYGEVEGRVVVALDTAAGCFRGQAARAPRKRVVPSADLVALLGKVSISASSVLGRAELTVRELLALKPNDLITLDTAVDSEVELHIEGQPKFMGTPLLNRGSLSLKVTRAVKE